MGDLRKHPNLLHRLASADEAREYIDNFQWEEYGFPNGKPISFLSRGKRFYPGFGDDQTVIECAIEMVLSLEIERAMQEKMFIEFEV